MDSRRNELEAFKSTIDLVAFAEHQGYEIDGRRTSRTSVSMHHPTGDRIIVAINGRSGHFIYASIHDPNDNGTIVDFCLKRGGASYTLGHVRKELRPWVGAHAAPFPDARRRGRKHRPRLQPVTVDLAAVRAAFAVMSPIAGENHYLTKVRAIPAAVYGHERFRGRIRVDDRGNVIFPHWQQDGAISGYELKNDGFTGFAPGGVKRLFCSGFAEDDTHLVVCESGIDVLSYAALHGIKGRRFVSTAGALSPEQVALLRSAIAKLPDGAELVMAVDADDGGDALAEQLEAIHEAASQGRVSIRRDSPACGQDWNDVLRGDGSDGTPAPVA